MLYAHAERRLPLYLSVSGRGSRGKGSKILGSLIHHQRSFQSQFLVQLLSFVGLHAFDGVFIDLDEGVGFHNQSIDQAVESVTAFIKVRVFRFRLYFLLYLFPLFVIVKFMGSKNSQLAL